MENSKTKLNGFKKQSLKIETNEPIPWWDVVLKRNHFDGLKRE